jgi:hypothetical protein
MCWAVLLCVLTGCQGKDKKAETVSDTLAGKPVSELFPTMEELTEWASANDNYMLEQLNAAASSSVKIEADTVYNEWAIPSFECGGGVWIARRPYGNRLVTMYTEVDCDANSLKLGVWRDGVYVFCYEVLISSMEYNEVRAGFGLVKSAMGDHLYDAFYGRDVCHIHNNSNGTEWLEVDWAKVSEEMLGEVFRSKIESGERTYSIVTAKDIEEGKNLKAEDFHEYDEEEI